MSKVGDWFFEKFLTLLLSGSSMILNTSPEISVNGTFTISDADIKKLIKQNKG